MLEVDLREVVQSLVDGIVVGDACHLPQTRR